MKLFSLRVGFYRLLPLLLVTLLAAVGCAGGEGEEKPGPAVGQRVFENPEAAGEALVAAAADFDTEALTAILGSEGVDLVVTSEPVLDAQRGADFASQAADAMFIERSPDDPSVAVLVVGAGEWPMPIPLVEHARGWYFDSGSGREEILLRRIGENELDAIGVCRGYVAAQRDYSLVRQPGSQLNQYAQRIISSPGTRDGLAWVDADGVWRGPVGQEIARAIEAGYQAEDPFHGYFFKVLKGQGPDAPLGEIDFVLDGAMIGGFALVAAPAQYEVTGVMTFIVSHDGIVYQKDLGPTTLEQFEAMELYNPDSSWEPVVDDEA